MTTTPTIPAGFYPYGATPKYMDALAELAERTGNVVSDRRWPCLRRLANPRHRCTACQGPTWQQFHGFPASVLDHWIWLKSPDRWSLLSQPYPPIDRTRLDELVQVSGALRWEHHGRAPYGTGTVAVLIVGRSITEAQEVAS